MGEVMINKASVFQPRTTYFFMMSEFKISKSLRCKSLAGVAPEMNLGEHVTHTPKSKTQSKAALFFLQNSSVLQGPYLCCW